MMESAGLKKRPTSPIQKWAVDCWEHVKLVIVIIKPFFRWPVGIISHLVPAQTDDLRMAIRHTLLTLTQIPPVSSENSCFRSATLAGQHITNSAPLVAAFNQTSFFQEK